MMKLGLCALALVACQGPQADAQLLPTPDFGHPPGRWDHLAPRPRVRTTPLSVSDLTDCSDLIVVATFTDYKLPEYYFKSSGPVWEPGGSYSIDEIDLGTVKIVAVVKGDLPGLKPLQVSMRRKGMIALGPTRQSPPVLTYEELAAAPVEKPDPHVGTTYLLFLRRMETPQVDRGLFPDLPYKKRVYRWETVDPLQHLHPADEATVNEVRSHLKPQI